MAVGALVLGLERLGEAGDAALAQRREVDRHEQLEGLAGIACGGLAGENDLLARSPSSWPITSSSSCLRPVSTSAASVSSSRRRKARVWLISVSANSRPTALNTPAAGGITTVRMPSARARSGRVDAAIAAEGEHAEVARDRGRDRSRPT